MIKMSDILDKINIYDVIFVVTVLVSFLISYKNGFLYSIVSLFKIIGSAIGAGYISKKYALYVYEKFFKDALVSKVAQKLADFRDGIINSFGQDVLGKAISDYLNKTALGSDLDQISETIVNESVQNTVVSGFQIIIFIIVFLILIVLVSFLQNILLHTNDVPVLGFMNQLFGGVFGAFIGLIILYLLSMVLSILVEYNAPYIYQKEIMSSYLFSIIYKINPFFK